MLDGFPDLAHDDEVDACSVAPWKCSIRRWPVGASSNITAARPEAEGRAPAAPQPVQSLPQPGSMEWSEAQKKKN